jgi:hypothetical protein
MRNAFPWYFRPTDVDYQVIWNTAILSTDANVLLDLYRYHQSTRDDLLTRLQEFKGRVWLTRQAAEEFFRNRNKVIVDALRTFETAQKDLQEIRESSVKASQVLKTRRLLPPDLPDRVSGSVGKALDSLEQEIAALRDAHPDYLRQDTILDSLADLFQDSVGRVLGDDVKSARLQEAARRHSERIPPGYMDDSTKEGDRKYGDCLIWMELLELAKERQCPIVLVTSEDKEDWWEKYSGRRVGPRPELLLEAHQHSGQRMLIYRTDQFVEIAADRKGTTVEPKVLEEIREVQKTPLPPTYEGEEADRLSDVSVPERARQALRRKDFGEVVELYRPYLRDNPFYHVGWTELGYALREVARTKAESGDREGAIIALRESLTALAAAMGHRDAVFRAEAEYQKSKTLYRLGAITHDSEKRSEAITAARRAHEIAPSRKYESWLKKLDSQG